jgi:hypothetical protein
MRRHRSIRYVSQPIALAFGLFLGSAQSGVAHAQATPPETGTTYSLTPEQKAEILANGTESRVDDSLLWARSGGDGKIHGEVGMEVGTRNTRGIYGDAVIPLGHGATAAFSFEDYHSDPGKFRWRRNQMYYVPNPNAP